VQLKNTALKAGLAINESKTKYMRIMRYVMEDRSDMRVEGMVFEEVTNFKYLGSLINEIGEEIKIRIAAGNRNYYGLQHLLRSRPVSRIVKIKFQYSVAVYNKVGKGQKFFVRNNKKNQQHSRYTEQNQWIKS
jgi:hypothetical protein